MTKPVAIILGPMEIARVAEVKDYAARDANWFNLAVPEKPPPPPGDNPAHVARLGNHRCVFSWTVFPDATVWRQLSVSLVPKAGNKVPSPESMRILAPLFGFNTGGDVHRKTGFPASWQIGLDYKTTAVVFAQRIEGLQVRVHLLWEGLPLCRFSLDAPGAWPTGERWDRIENAPRVPRALRCRDCFLLHLDERFDDVRTDRRH